MAKRRKKKTNPALPKWAVTVFAVIAVVLSIFTFGGDLIGIDTSFAQQAMDFIDRILYGGPTGPTPSLPVSGCGFGCIRCPAQPDSLDRCRSGPPDGRG